MNINVQMIEEYIKVSGLKPAYISRKTGIPEQRLGGLLEGRQKLKVGEYVALCQVLDVPMCAFVINEAPQPL